jgi:long-subunit acyl-CoA synthetase (AMP-forming)
VKLCSEEWTTSNALVTPALKIRRKNIQQFYESDIDRMYGKDK